MSEVVRTLKNFNIKQIVECGQCFRWEKKGENNYIGVANNKVIEVIQNKEEVKFLNVEEEEFNDIWEDYFDLNRDYTAIKKELKKDEILKKSINFGYGIRILNQEPFEMLISFIISARNSIPSIKKTIKKMCENWGVAINYKGDTYYTFPTVEALKNITEEEIKSTGASFRSKYIVDTIKKLNSNELNLEQIRKLEARDCHKALQEFKGVGAKVADCVMLFSMGKESAFPVDVWVKRAMMFFYEAEESSLNKIRIFGQNKFKENAGVAQQYLFYYARENKIKV